jgi:hypothetical protein
MKLPSPRGPLSRLLCDWLSGAVTPDVDEALALVPGGDPLHDPLADGDLQLSLWVMYELHYRGFEGVDDAWEWSPELLTLRSHLERPFEAALRELTRESVDTVLASTEPLPETLFAFCADFDGPSLGRLLLREATREQMQEFLAHRSVYALKEADPTTFALPRLTGPMKVALAEVQYDEYGGGRPDRLHQQIFATTLEAVGLDPTYGRYVDDAPALVLASANAQSLLGLHRRLRGAAVGHFAAFEATSSLPSRKIAGGLRRLGFPDAAAAYYDEHVEADAVHEQIAMRDLCGGLVAAEPELTEDVVFGAAVCLHVDALVAADLLESWAA